MDNQNMPPTTFGVTIGRSSRSSTPIPATTHKMVHHEDFRSISRQSVPSSSPLPSSNTSTTYHTPSVVAPSPIMSHASMQIPARLHLAPTSQVASVEAPLPSPYSISEDMSHEKASDLEAGLVYHDDSTNEKDFAPACTERFSNAVTATTPEDEQHESHLAILTKAGTVNVAPIPSRQPSSASATTSLTAAIRTRTDEEKYADGRVRECTMWPTQDELRHRHRREKILRSCNPMLRLSKRNRIIVSILIALTVIGLAIGVGVGVSKAYNGGVWAGNGKNIPLPSS